MIRQPSQTGRDSYETKETKKIDELHYTGDQVPFTYIYYSDFNYTGSFAIYAENQFL